MTRPADWISPFAPAEGPPPRTLLAFFRWALSGAWGVLCAGSVFAIAVGVVEVVPGREYLLVTATPDGGGA